MLALVLVFLVRQLVVYLPLIRENRRRIAAAEQYVPVLRQQLRGLAGASGVDVGWTTSGDGTVVVHGEVRSSGVILAISNAIVELKPSVPVRVQMTIAVDGAQPIEWNWGRERPQEQVK